jgi:hypothetical protein
LLAPIVRDLAFHVFAFFRTAKFICKVKSRRAAPSIVRSAA